MNASWLDRGIDPPALRRIDRLYGTSGITGGDPRTGQLPGDPTAQFECAFANLRALLAAHALGPETIGLVNVFIAGRDTRPLIDLPWLAMFPNAEQRPARKTNEVGLPDGVHVQVQAFGIAGESCRSLEIPGLRHRGPLPMGAIVGSTVFSSVIGGDDPATGAPAEDPDEQIAQAFRNATRLMEQAGGSASGINHLWVFLGDMAHAPSMLDEYLALFPDPSSRPARKTVPYALPGGLAVQLQIVGDTGARSANFEVPGIGHHDPIPLASQAGRLLQSSGIYGIDPETSKMVEGGLVEQTHASLDILERLMARAGVGLSAVAVLTILVRSYADAAWLAEAVADRFTTETMPALRFIAYPLPDELAVQFHATAWI
jgi:2-iminobutanoate/2-iminopropanoate deaminase